MESKLQKFGFFLASLNSLADLKSELPFKKYECKLH
jgi:hypothetical protein